MAKVPDEQLEAVDWNKTFQRLVAFAHRKLGYNVPVQEAEDLAGEAIRRFLDPDYAGWDPGRQPSVIRQLGSIVNGMLRNRWRNKIRQYGVAVDFASSEVAATEPAPIATPEERALSRNMATHALKLLEHEIKGDDVSESLLLLEIDGVVDPAAQAEALALPLAKIYKARFKLGQAREAVRRRMLERGLA